MTPFPNKNKFLDSTHSLSDGRYYCASMFCLIRLIDETGKKTFQVNERIGLFFRCFAGSESFCVSSCSCHLISTFLAVLPIWLLTRAYIFVNNTSWMGVSTFKFKQLFNSLNHPLNTYILFIISANNKLSDETFGKFFILWTVWYIHRYNLF